MATYTNLTLEQGKAIGSAFGLVVTDVRGVPAGSVNSNYRLTAEGVGPIFARIYEEQGQTGAEGEARLLDHLARDGVATPRPLARADGSGFTYALRVLPSGELGGERAVALFPWRDGEILCQARVTPEIARIVGEKLAEVHRAAASFPEPRPGRFGIADLRARLLRIEQAADTTLRAMADPIRHALSDAERARDHALPHAVIHGDLFRDNVLWQNGRVSAFLDFESACDGPLAYDLMVTALAWCYGEKLEEPLVRAMFQGYASVRRPSARELVALAAEGRIAALRFTITRITDFAMRTAIGDRVTKDYRRFWARYEAVTALGSTLEGWFS